MKKNPSFLKNYNIEYIEYRNQPHSYSMEWKGLQWSCILGQGWQIGLLFCAISNQLVVAAWSSTVDP